LVVVVLCVFARARALLACVFFFVVAVFAAQMIFVTHFSLATTAHLGNGKWERGEVPPARIFPESLVYVSVIPSRVYFDVGNIDSLTFSPLFFPFLSPWAHFFLHFFFFWRKKKKKKKKKRTPRAKKKKKKKIPPQS
jgi:hypothetical protein